MTQDLSGGAYDGYLYIGMYTADGTDDDHIYRSVDDGRIGPRYIAGQPITFITSELILLPDMYTPVRRRRP
jgi:hypothetical protein